MKPETAYLLTDMLRTAAAQGTARALSGSAETVAGKTGTSTGPDGGVRDLWIAGYTPDMVGVVWMGYDEPDAHALPSNLGGGGYPARLLAKLFSSIDAGRRDFVMPETLIACEIDRDSLEQSQLVRLAVPGTAPDRQMTELFYADEPPILYADAEDPSPELLFQDLFQHDLT